MGKSVTFSSFEEGEAGLRELGGDQTNARHEESLDTSDSGKPRPEAQSTGLRRRFDTDYNSTRASEFRPGSARSHPLHALQGRVIVAQTRFYSIDAGCYSSVLVPSRSDDGFHRDTPLYGWLP